MNWIVTISALPDKREQLTVEARSSVAALRDVLGREMVAAALERRPGASLCISVMKPAGEVKAMTNDECRMPNDGGLTLR